MNAREKFLSANPLCVFCGGGEPATTIEHCPPRALFQHRHWPEGFDFAACSHCNHGTADDDAIVAMLARVDPLEASSSDDGRTSGLIKNVAGQFPGMIQRMLPSPIEARAKNRLLGVRPGPGQTHQDIAPALVTREISHAVETFSCKLAKAIYYREMGTIYPSEGTLHLAWFTNQELFQHGKYVLFDILKDIPGRAVPLRRGGKYLDDQFQYKFTPVEDSSLFVLQAKFGASFGVVIFGSSLPNVLEPRLEELMLKTGKRGPFVRLQPRHNSAA